MSAADPVLRIDQLSVGFDLRDGGRLTAVDGVTLELGRGELLALVGESGSGKSSLAMSLVGLNRGPGTNIDGRVEFDGTDLLSASDKQLRAIRGRDIAVVFQDALAALNPLQRVGTQVSEMLRQHARLSRADAWRRSEQLLADVGIARPERNARAYPHQFSGGMRQRVMTAIALANNPAILIADEPTTALDVTIQRQILLLLRRLQDEQGTAILLITHDLGVVADVADRVAVMYGGRIVEQGTRDQVLYSPQHPYTMGLLNSMPRMSGPARSRLPVIPGSPLAGAPSSGGCAFAPRCAFTHAACDTAPELAGHTGQPGHLDACWLPVHEREARS
ncbi:MAG: ABC transporter ATP-binding protein [Streptosporangiaceae bacterium]|jgi:oligopeptide/dipeptide ABC transporter ATP-binding protein